jgi:hypothetical protein
MRLQQSQFRWQRVAHKSSSPALRSGSRGGAAPAAAAAPQQATTSGKKAVDPAADWHVRLLQTASNAKDGPKKKKAPRFPEWSSNNILEEGDEFNESDAGAGAAL